MRWHAALGLASALVILGLASPLAAQNIPPLEQPHYLGIQVGGSSYFQVAGRVRVTGPLVLELGAFGYFVAGGGGNGSIGLSFDYPFAYVSPFVSAGGGFGLGCGEGSDHEVDPETGETVEVVGLSCTGTVYGYTRAGINLNFDRERTMMLSLDGGFWHGVIDGDGVASRLFFWPMLGVGLYIRFPVVS
jgi:hypothetical protein